MARLFSGFLFSLPSLRSEYIVVISTSSWFATHICNHCYLLFVIDCFQKYQICIWIYICSCASVRVHRGFREPHSEVYCALFLVDLWIVSSHCDMLCRSHWAFLLEYFIHRWAVYKEAQYDLNSITLTSTEQM